MLGRGLRGVGRIGSPHPGLRHHQASTGVRSEDDAPTTNQKYVRQGASGTASGNDWTNAYTTLPATLTRDTTYWIADGSYSGYTFDDTVSGSLVIRVKKATAALHGTDTGWSSGYGDGQATFSSGLSFLTNYITVDGSVGGGPDSWSSGHGFRVTETDTSTAVLLLGQNSSRINVSNINIAHIDAIGNASDQSGGGNLANDGVAWFGGSNVNIRYCYFHDIGRCPFFISGSNFIVEYCHVANFLDTNAAPPGDTHGEIASIWDFSAASENVTFRFSLFTDCQSTGGIMFDASSGSGGCYVYGNVFYETPAKAWGGSNGVIGGWSSYPTTNMKAFNNTFINIEDVIFGIGDTTGTGEEIKNNLFYSCGNPGGLAGATTTHNHFISTSTIGINTSTGSGDPFVDYAGLDFRLTGNTTAGTDLGSDYNVDMYGNTRTTWTRGAVEYV